MKGEFLVSIKEVAPYERREDFQPVLEKDEVWGDTPPNISQVPSQISIGSSTNPRKLENTARGFLDDYPHLLQKAMDTGEDVIAQATSHGWVLVIGAGVAGVVAAAGIGYVLYRHHKGPVDK